MEPWGGSRAAAESRERRQDVHVAQAILSRNFVVKEGGNIRW